MTTKTLSIVVLVVAAIVLNASLYVVDETEQVVITRFGEAVGEPIRQPGLKVKAPLIHKVNRFAKNLLEWDGEKGRIPTKDKTYIWVDVFARWRIMDPLKYFQNVNNETNAQGKLDNIINAAVRNLVTSNPLIETVRNTNRKMDLTESELVDTSLVATQLTMGRGALSREILAQSNPKLIPLGIEIVDVKFKRINYTDEVLNDVYGRMIAERKQIAEKFRSEGKGESERVKGQRIKELERIYSEAKRDAEILKGHADATAARIYARAYGRDPEFYSFVKTLDIYRESMDSTTTAVLSTKNEFLKYLSRHSARR